MLTCTYIGCLAVIYCSVLGNTYRSTVNDVEDGDVYISYIAVINCMVAGVLGSRQFQQKRT